MEKLYFTEEQKQILDMEKAYPNQGICNIGGRVTFSDKYDKTVVRAALRVALAENEMLKVRVNRSYQPYVSTEEIEVGKWQGTTLPTMKDLSIWLSRPFSFFDGPLYELCLFENEDVIELYVKVHHLLMDGYAIATWMRRYEEVYWEMMGGPQTDKVGGFLECMKAVPEISSPKREKDMEWFRGKALKTSPDTWHIRKSHHREVYAERIESQVPEALFQKMKEMSTVQGISTEILFVAALGIYVSKVTGSREVAIGRAVANRKKKERNLLGMKANTIPVCMHVEDGKAFSVFCQEIKQYFYEMLHHADFSIGAYQKQEKIQEAYYDVAVSYRSAKYMPLLEGQEQREIANLNSELPLRLFLNETEETLRLELLHQLASYTTQEAKAILERLVGIVEQGMEGMELGAISLLSKEDETAWEKLNARQDTELPDGTVPEYIQKQVQKYANSHIAVQYENETMSYENLEDISDYIAAALRRQGVKPGNVVGVQMKNCLWLPAVFYGVWKCRAAFLPISPKENPKRLEHTKCYYQFFLDEAWLKDLQSDYTNREKRKGQSPENSAKTILPEDIAYEMFTSGSTGEPKVVKISHKSLFLRLFWMQKQYRCEEKVLQKAAYTFDVSMWEYFLPLMAGGTLYLTKEEEKANPAYLADVLSKYQISTVHFVPSVLGVFLEYAKSHSLELPHLTHVFSSGEALSAELVKVFYELFPKADIHNLYGPTECTIDVTYYDCTGKETEIPIGKPVFFTKAEILGADGKKQPRGIEGELVISGPLVGEGYVGEQSGGFFVGEDGKEKRYYTKDHAVLGYDGEIYYRGRKDGQCKIHGMRVDLNQIQATMLQCPGVLRCVVGKQENRLVAIYMAEKELPELSGWLSARLPYYSVPSKILYQKEIPLTKNGKTDNTYLKEVFAKIEIENPQGLQETILWECVCQKLGYKISVDENMFLAGVDSLGLVEILADLEKRGLYYTIEDFYSALTIRQVAQKQDRGVQWLSRQAGKHLLMCFPYAAGTAETFYPIREQLADDPIDICVVSEAKYIPEISTYESVLVMGYCTGTTAALQGVQKLVCDGKNVIGVILCAALPPVIAKKTPYRFFSDAMVMAWVDFLHGEHINTNAAWMHRFRKDTEEFYRFFAGKPEAQKVKKVVFFFGEKDILTLFSRFGWKRWKRYVQGKMNIRIQKGQRHFFLEECSKDIAKEIIEMIQEEET